MRSAEQIMDDLGIDLYFEGDENSVKCAIKEAMKGAIEECAKKAQVSYDSRRYSDPWHVDKDSILNLIQEIK